MPHCIAAIDGRHIRIRKPAGGIGYKFWNYKGFYSIVLQAVVDVNYRFMFIDVGGYGSQHDAGTFRASDFCRALENNLLDLPEPSQLPGSNVKLPYFFVGDNAYPIMENLMKPVPGKELPPIFNIYNKRISRGRSVAENAFALKCQIWRIFYTTIQTNPEVVDLIVKCCCLLQNILIDMSEINQDNLKFENNINEVLPPVEEAEREEYEEDFLGTLQKTAQIRDNLALYFNNNPL